MRNPNGYGGITVLPGNRRNPYRVRITKRYVYDKETGKSKQEYFTLGYYPTRKAAMIALAEYNKDPYDLDKAKITFEDIYIRWSADAYPKLSESAVNVYKAAYRQLEPLHDAKISSLKKKELQDVMDSLSGLSKSYQTKTKSLMRAVFGYCIENDLIEKDYSRYVKINDNDDGEQKHVAYTEEEIKKLWDNLHTPIPFKYSAKDIREICVTDLVLIAIYTGLRPGELLQIKTENVHLEDRYMIGGFKTKAGTDRIIPIHDDIFPLVEKRYNEAGEWLIPYKSDSPPTMNQFRAYMFDPLMSIMEMNHLPHDGRHTFATFGDRSNAKEHIIKLIMGHKTGDITEDGYTHVSVEDMVKEVNQIVFVKG